MTSYHDVSYLRTLKKKELQDILRTQELAISGNKSELITRILNDFFPLTGPPATYAFVRGSDAFENLMSCFEEWCEESNYALHKQTTSVRFEKVSTNEFRYRMEGVETPGDFLDRFWICWMNESWGMDNEDIEEFKNEAFMREFQELYAKKMAIMMPDCCIGCLEGQPNQLAHMGQGGCLHTEDDSDFDSDLE